MSSLEDSPSESSSANDSLLAELRSALASSYVIEGEVGRGGMAVVYRAMDVRHSRPVALKVLHPELSAAIGADRFLREIQIEAQLNHPHVLSVIDSGRTDRLLYYLTPWADGGTLRSRLTREPQLPLEDALQIVREVGGALDYAHRSGIIHRDVKPENILFRSGHAMLADFGIARAIADTDTDVLTDSGLALGTPHYMSPEQASGSKSVDLRSDQYALACVLFEMLVGDPPFTGRTARAIMARHLVERPPSIEVVRPDIPANVVSAVNRALEKTPAARFVSVEQFLDALRPVEPGAATVALAGLRRRPLLVAGVVTAVAAAVALMLSRPDQPLSPNRVAVFPLATRGLSPADSGVGVGVAYLVEAAFERAEPLQFVDAAAALSPAQRANPEGINARDTRRIGRDLGAAFALHGIVQGHPDSTTVILRLFSVAGDSLIRQASVSGSATAPLHHLGIDAVKSLLPALIDPTREIDLAPLRDRRARAIALWMQGERYYRRSQFDSASRAYERAVEDDSALAMAAIKGAQAASWLHQRDRGLTLVNQALSREALLPPRYVLLARGLRSYLNGSADSAIAQLTATRALAPDWVEPVALLGETYSHLLPSDGPVDSLARAAFVAAVARDSGFTSPLYHLAEDAIREGRLTEAGALVNAFRAAGAEARLARQLELMLDCVRQNGAVSWSTSSAAVMVGVFEAGKSLSAGGRQFRCADGAFRAVLRSQHVTDGERWGAFLGVHGLLVARGASREAKALIDSIVGSGKGAARTLYVLDALAGAHTTEDAEALVAYARAQFGDNYERLKTAESLWVLLVWHASRGDTSRVRIIADTLTSRSHSDSTPRLQMFAAAGRAQAMLARLDTTAAIDLLLKLPAAGAAADLAWQFGDALPVERLLLAKLLLAKGRYAESLRSASVFDHPVPIMFLPFLSESLRIRYEAALALSADSAANSARARLIALGRDDLVQAVSLKRR